VKHLHTAFAALVVFLALAAPRLALACSVCSAYRDDEANRAFVLTTIFLSLLPIAMFAGFGAWLWLRYRRRMRELAPAPAMEPAPVPTTPSLPELS
jgi:Na+/pantothenate symporter